MKSVLISVNPKWCELIASGKKTVEVRKTRPKIGTPFKCYIYCTSKYYRKGDGYFQGKYCGKIIGEFVCDKIDNYEMEGYDKTDTVYQNIRRIVDEDDDTTAFMEVSNDMSEVEISDSRLLKQSCLSFDDIGEYVAGGKEFGFYDFYGWHISDLVIYDRPKELSEFITFCPEWEKEYFDTKCLRCKYYFSNCADMRHECAVEGERALKRPPQSWCYVESQ